MQSSIRIPSRRQKQRIPDTNGRNSHYLRARNPERGVPLRNKLVYEPRWQRFVLLLLTLECLVGPCLCDSLLVLCICNLNGLNLITSPAVNEKYLQKQLWSVTQAWAKLALSSRRLRTSFRPNPFPLFTVRLFALWFMVTELGFGSGRHAIGYSISLYRYIYEPSAARGLKGEKKSGVDRENLTCS